MVPGLVPSALQVVAFIHNLAPQGLRIKSLALRTEDDSPDVHEL